MGQSQGKAKENEELLLTSSTTKTTSKEGNYILSIASKLSKALPTGILFVLQALSNLINNNGESRTAAYLRNRSPSSALHQSIPYEVWFGYPPSVRHLRIFGSTCYALIPKDKRNASTGKVHCGISTINGIATCNKVKLGKKSDYRLKVNDLMHAAVALVVFTVMALTNQNIVQCLYPSAQSNINKVLQVVPIVVIGVSSVIVGLVPSKLNGITSPVTTGTST
ncbi:protein DMP2-like [Cryptomeria japonica]|uniref:protein DMP2-like n=1 Tax=Cryptomeria japonica TaxID=3369 RepID=UPI0027DA909F|nr:protein DMP2-like [Cryptomeria japonica]